MLPVDGKFLNVPFPASCRHQNHDGPHLNKELHFRMVFIRATVAVFTDNLFSGFNRRLSSVKGHFPKLTDCAHFHYDNVDFGSIEVSFNRPSQGSGVTGMSGCPRTC